MNYIMRKFLFTLALAVAVSPVMAKDEKKTDKKDKARSGLVREKKPSTRRGAEKGTTAEGKSQYKKVVVNINKANAAALSAYLVGIGPVKAKAIVNYRSKKGKFSATAELMDVEGIGESTFKGLKKNVSTTRGETAPPKGYKMGETSGKKKKGSRSLSRKEVDKAKGKAKAKRGSSKVKTGTTK